MALNLTVYLRAKSARWLKQESRAGSTIHFRLTRIQKRTLRALGVATNHRSKPSLMFAGSRYTVATMRINVFSELECIAPWIAGSLLALLCSCANASPTPGRSADGGTPNDAGACFSCEGRWICGGDVTYISLVPEADGCHLSGLPGRKLIDPDGTIREGMEIVGNARGLGARVTVERLDGSVWLHCAGGGGCNGAR